MAIKLKTVIVEGKTYAEVIDGKPIYVHDDGSEHPFDAVTTTAKISTLNREAQTHREAKEAAEASLKQFEGLDVTAARTALDTVKNLDDKKLMDAGKVEEIKNAAIKAVEDKYSPVVAERDSLKKDIFGERLSSRFANSKFITDKMAVPADVVKAVFSGQWRDENGKPVPYDMHGNKIYSQQNPGSEPDFEEAMSIMVNAYPHKNGLLKGTGGGSGARENGAGGGANGNKVLTRAEFDRLDASTKNAKLSEGFALVD